VTRDLVERYFRAMQRGPDGEDDLVALFAEDAVYVEPFTGGTHEGRDAIRAWLNGSRADAPPDLRLTVERVDVAGDTVEAHWTCESPAFARPATGRDRFTIRDGRIARLESTLVQAPELRGGP
jgi:ketosteroid isomerase-like protein